MVSFQGQEEVVVIEPWNDGEEVEVSYYPLYSQFQLSVNMPQGIDQRVADDEIEERDTEYLAWIVDNHSNRSFKEMLNAENDKDNRRLCFLIMEILSIIYSNYESPEWEEYSSKTPSFLERGTLGVK